MSRRLLCCLHVLTVLLALAPAHAEWSSGGSSQVPLDGSPNGWHVRATLNGGFSGLFLLDTGASFCVLAPSTARALDLAMSGEQVQVQTANGTVRAPAVRLRTLDVGGNRARDVRAVVHNALPPPLAGIIGLSFLNNFSYAIDPKWRVLRLQ